MNDKENILNDKRVTFLRQRVTLTLELPVETFNTYFNDKDESEKLLSFLSKKYYTGSAIFFSSNKWKENIEIEGEEEVVDDSVIEPIEKIEEPVVSPPVVETITPAVSPKPEGKARGTKLDKKSKNKEKAVEKEVPVVIPEPEVIPVEPIPEVKRMKIIKVKRLETIDKYCMYMSIDKITPEMNDRTTVMFIRSTDGDIPMDLDARDPFSFNKQFEFSIIVGDLLQGIASMVHQLYLPTVQSKSKPMIISDKISEKSKPENHLDKLQLSSEQKEELNNNQAENVDESLRHELTSNITKFEQQLRHVVKQSRGDARLVIPSFMNNLTNITLEQLSQDNSILVELENTLDDWISVIAGTVEQEVSKSTKNHHTPLGEIEYWRDRQVNISSLYDQLSTSKVNQIVELMKTYDNAQIGSFNYHFGELAKLYLEAKDNVKFLSTLERHFKHISDGTFQTILESIPSMITGLKMVWTVSRHYNTDERMAPLMEMIAETLVKRIKDEIKLSHILAIDFNIAYRLVTEARDVLLSWSENYFRMRKKIEENGSDHRWEFDRKALFSKTDYISEICGNLLEIITALNHFKVFLGPELKAVTGNSAGIDIVLKRVDNLYHSLKILNEEKIFDKTFEKTWDANFKKFRTSVIEIEKMTESFIKDSFRKLRSAEGAFELVQNFQKIGSQSSTNTSGNAAPSSTGSITQLISDRYNDILEQYSRELVNIKHLFDTYKQRPLLYKNYPPVAGAIAWARDLYLRAKRPIIRFKKHGGLLESSDGEIVKSQYLEFARTVDAYINDLFVDWETNIAVSAVDKLRQSVLKSINSNVTVTNNNKSDFVLPPPPYRVNFPYELKMIIKESKSLDKLGFHIPEGALNVTLQENKYQEIIRTLNAKLLEYDNILGSLQPIEKQLLKHQIDELNTTIKTGFYPLNWTSQRIPSYIDDLNQAIVRFNSIVTQVHKNSDMINEILTKISTTQLVVPSDFYNKQNVFTPLDITEFFEIIETNRINRLTSLVDEYNSIGESFLLKVEEIVAKTATGFSPTLASYYFYWEKCIYNAVVKMIVLSTASLLALLQIKDGPTLFRINVSLNGKELVVSPTLTDIDKFLQKSVKNMAESAKVFIRWMNGTCILTPPQFKEDEEVFEFSYYDDVEKNPEIVKLIYTLTNQTGKVYSTANKYLDGWRRYDRVMALWNPKRKQQVEKLRPTCANLDSAMSNFQGIRETVEAQPVYKDIEFLHIDVTSVALGVAKQAEVWKSDYGEVLLTTSRVILFRLIEKINTLEEQIKLNTNNLDELKFVLNIIQHVQSLMQDVELEILDIDERYRTLLRYNIAVPADELNLAVNISNRWRTLYVNSRTRNLQLVDTKQQFREVTAKQDIEFRNEIDVFRREYEESGPGTPNIDLEVGIEILQLYKTKINKFNITKQQLINAQNLFNLSVKPYPLLQQTAIEIEQLDKIYILYKSFKEFKDNMSSILWNDLDITLLRNGLENIEKLCKRLPSDLKKLPIFLKLEENLNNFNSSLPIVFSLKNDAMKNRHWVKIQELTNIFFDITLKSLTLGNIFNMNLYNFSVEINDIITEAMNENKIDNELIKIENKWKNYNLSILRYKKDGQDRGYVLKSSDEIKIELEDNMLNLQTINSSKYVSIFIDKVKKWEKMLNIVSECLEVWYIVQKKWIYLEGIFIGAEDIRMQLPDEAKKFDTIDKIYKTIMLSVNKNPNVLDSCINDNRLSVLQNLSERLDNCQKSLSDYLDSKRCLFPRFFFISDDELLSILGSSDPTLIQIHLLKLFDNIKELRFIRNNKFIDNMTSVEKETVPFNTNIPIEGPVESWMTAIENEMHTSLHNITKEGVYLYAQMNRIEWLKQVIGMVGLVGSQIWWTWQVEDTFHQVLQGNKYAMKDLESKLSKQLNDLVVIIRSPLDNIMRKKVNTLLIIDVHARDIVDNFVKESILNSKEFAWESQLRFYWDKNVDDCIIKQCTGKFRYGYEYMGLNGRLVITPLTDRCYMTLTQALTFKLGGSPSGPAGTGKTETTKDLAKSLALPCFVINCGDGLDYKAMGSIFSGLVQVGAWGCFDEFNRINIEVLSVVSAQLRAIQNSLIYEKPTCDIGFGRDITIKRVAGFATCGFFITMNPGYAGRTELPDNLKALFRPVTMIVPDFLQICEIMLFSEGFEEAKLLAKKMTVLYKLGKEQLSKQFHYDFGLRALKSVLVMAGGLKREYSYMSEELVLMRCLRDSNMPKFVYEDVPLFTGLINDLFPGLDCPRVGYDSLKEAAMNDLTLHGYKTQLVRHTTMIVGPSGGGKTLLLETLKNSRLVSENVVVKMYILNPKAQPLNELYGEMDPVTRDWTDGILSKLFRELNDRLPPGKENEMRWIVYDGDVDALWVENMNSVMDDNRLLTLPNGERIRLQSHCAMICETFDLQYASPATISRCGMVWVDPKNLGYKPYYERWIKQRFGNNLIIEESKQDTADYFLALFDKFIPACIDMILSGVIDGDMGKKLPLVIPISNIDMIKQLCCTIDAFLPVDLTDSMDIEAMYIFSIVWSLGASIVGIDARSKFDIFLKKLSRELLPDGLLYDYYYDITLHKWEKWLTKVPKYVEPNPFKFFNVMVPTTDSVLYTHILSKLAPIRPILFIGESGTAKTTIIQNYLSIVSSNTSNNTVSNYLRLNMNFSSRTTSMDVQNNIEANIDKRSGAIYGPPSGKKLLIFIDDLNMPKVDLYGTQQPIALLLFLISKNYLYDRKKDLNIKIIKDLQYIGAMGPPGGGRNPVDPRFVALFNVFNLIEPSNAILQSIYSSIITSKYREFNDGVKAAVTKITTATLRLYHHIIDKMPPTPSKFHYIFNLRDISRVYEGLSNATTDVIGTSPEFVRLWRHECDRIFYDRLTNFDDQTIYQTELHSIIKENFPDAFDSAVANPCLYGDFEHAYDRIMSDNELEDSRLYKDMSNYNTVSDIFNKILELYNESNKQMNLVLFEQAIEHVCRIHRIIRQPRGNALLVGIGGSGKQSLTKLACYCAGYKLFQINLTRGYNELSFKDDLKELYKSLGKEEVVFLFTDNHVVEEGFLEYINNILTIGIVPSLYDNDEKDQLCNSVRAEAKTHNISETTESLWSYYISKCRNNLHVVISMSPSGNKLRLRCRNFPGLVSNCVIDWFFTWPFDALEKVAKYFLQDNQYIAPEHMDNIINHMVFTHLTVTSSSTKYLDELRRYYYVTPKNYLDYIYNYTQQLLLNNKRIDSSIKRLEGGLIKLIEAANAVDNMSMILKEKKVIVDSKTADVQVLISVIQEKTEVANENQQKASIKQKYAEEQRLLITKQKEEADVSLSEALPAVEAAARALESLDRNDLTEIKAFANPPEIVKKLGYQLIHLKPTDDKLDESWNDVKKLLGNPNLLTNLKNYPKDNITEKQIRKVNKQFSGDDLDAALKTMQGVSKAGFGLLTWVVAIVRYYEVSKSVLPLRNKVKEMEKAMKQTENELNELNSLLSKLSDELRDLNIQYEAANNELNILQSEASIMTKRLNTASKLIDGLTNERNRWSNDIIQLKQQNVNIIGDCLVSSAFLSYLGAFTTDYRTDLINNKFLVDLTNKQIPLSNPFNLESLLTTDTQIQSWIAKGLPSDEHSIQNGILTTISNRFPLCIDPQQQAVNWIKRTYVQATNTTISAINSPKSGISSPIGQANPSHNQSNNFNSRTLTVKQLTDNDFMKHLELAIQFGNIFLFENIDEDIDPLLDPILEKNIFLQGNSYYIKLGDKTIEWDINFRLYLTTKLANPHYSPEIMGKVMIINYGVTINGLSNQLLNVVVGHERPDLEKQWSDLVNEISENGQLLTSLEDTLLRELSNSQGNILDNSDLINTLENTKIKVIDISNKLTLSYQTKEDISVARSVYKPVSKRGSILYFAQAGLTTISSMYEISLDSFLIVFKNALVTAKKDSNLDNRLRNMIDTIMRQIYDYTTIGIFERHKLMFSFQMTCMILAAEENNSSKSPTNNDSADNTENSNNKTNKLSDFDPNLLDFFLKGDTSLDSLTEENPVTWITNSGWKDLLYLSTINIPVFNDLIRNFKSNLDVWKEWYDLEAPEVYPLPNNLTNKLTSLQKLCLMRCIRPDRVVNSIKMFIIDTLGEKYIQPPVIDYQRIYNQSSCNMPMVFILSPGADPQADIQKFCDEMSMTNRFKFIALGQGQGPIAEVLLETGIKRGHWVLLQNCHLLTSWLKTLEKILNEMKDTPHKDFRLWLTTEPTDKFPLGILQKSLKVVTEPPDGLKLNMKAIYSKLSNDVLDECPHNAYKSCLFVLAYLHAVVLERRKYGKIGWNVNYDFNESDYIISRKLISLYLLKSYEDNDEYIPWNSLKYLIGSAMYGGRVSDDMDRRILTTYLEEYMGDFLFDNCNIFLFSNVGYNYNLPANSDLENYQQIIEDYPLTNSPAVFGLHPNAEIGYYTNAVKSMWIDLISLQPRRSGSNEGISREDYISNTASDIYNKIPLTSLDIGSYDIIQTRTLLLKQNSLIDKTLDNIITPCQVVLLQELERWNNLVKRMAISLQDLKRALIGEIGMSDELDSLGDSLYNGFVPSLWRKLAPDTQKPLSSWMNHYTLRYKQYDSWIKKGEPLIMWLSGLHIPESYLTALVQTTCRKKNWPLDKSTLYTMVTKYTNINSKSIPLLESGCYVHGLYLEGAGWDIDKSSLCLQSPKVLVTELPIMQVIPIEGSKLKLHNTFKTPVYVTQNRRNAMGVGLVFEADLATSDHSSHWVLQGVALSLNIDT